MYNFYAIRKSVLYIIVIFILINFFEIIFLQIQNDFDENSSTNKKNEDDINKTGSTVSYEKVTVNFTQ